MGSRVIRRGAARCKFCVLSSLAVLLLLTLSVAQTQSSSSKTSSNTPAGGSSTDAKPDSTNTAPDDKSGKSGKVIEIEGVQQQMKRLHDYMNPVPPAKDMGKPDIKVWADLHTALYFCPGAKQYGHTSKGKYMTQKQAQDSNFESALRVPCPAAAPVVEKKKLTKSSKTTAKKSSTPSPTAKQQN
jgi:hypothetical protein